MRSFYAWGVIGLLSTIACSNGAKQSDPTAPAVAVDTTSPTEAEPPPTEAPSPTETPSPTEAPAPPAAARKLEKLVLRHQGPPVSPEYARSYVITITPGKIHRETMGPKRAVAQQEQALEGDDLSAIEAALVRHEIRAQPEPTGEDEGCAGGVSYTIERTYAGAAPEKLQVYLCGGSARGTLAGDVKALADDVNGLIGEPLP